MRLTKWESRYSQEPYTADRLCTCHVELNDVVLSLAGVR
jgi:hypothetical protein